MDEPWLLDLHPRSCVLVPTRSLQSHLTATITQGHIHRGDTVWESPNVLTWQDYLSKHWHLNQTKLPQAHTLLSAAQSQLLWEQIIDSKKYADKELTLLNTQQTARAAYRSWQQTHDWQLDLAAVANQGWQDATEFVTWAQDYLAALARRGLIDVPVFFKQLIALMEGGEARTPFAEVTWFGFDLITDAQRSWQSLESQNQVRHNIKRPSSMNETTIHRSYPTTRDELYHVFHQARNELESNPDQSLSIVIPDLAQRKSQVASIAKDVFYPSDPPLALKNNDLAYRFSLGGNLTDWEPINAALNCLNLMSGQLTLNDLSWLLRSRALGINQHFKIERVTLEQHLRGKRITRISLKQLVEQLELCELGSTSVLGGFCLNLLEFKQSVTATLAEKKALPLAQWRTIFSDWLKHWKWTAASDGINLNSADFQLYERWQDLLLEFESLATITPALGLSRAMRRLRQLANDAIFLPQAASAPIFISGVYESIGLSSDVCFLTGMSQMYPAPHAADPFLGEALKRHTRYPNATPARELEQARQVIDSLMQSKRKILVSYAEQDERNGDIKLTPSSLLRDRTFTVKNAFARAKTAVNLESLIDDNGAPVSLPRAVPGGVSVFTDQSHCAFRAFARHRLGCRTEDEDELGVAPVERGTLIHAVLENAWARLQSQAQLHTLQSEQQLQAFVQRVVTDTYDALSQGFNEDTQPLVLLEQAYMEDLLLQWLEFEASRPQGFGIAGLEESGSHTISGLEFRYKIDRIDVTDDGKTVVIDYKTGNCKRRDLHGERLQQPQLALYAYILSQQKNTPPSGVALAQVKLEECKFEELAEVDLLRLETRQSIKFQETWTQAKNEWPDQLQQLADDFIAGHASVDPIDAQACKYCGLQPLCRIHQQDNLVAQGGQNE